MPVSLPRNRKAKGLSAAPPASAPAEPRVRVRVTASEPTPAPAGGSRGWRDYLQPRPLPWWLVFLLAMFLLAKSQILLDSPCAVLGTQSPVSRAKISKAHRAISLCTHPDKLPDPDKMRGQVLFERATHARDALMHHLSDSGQREVECKGNEIEMFLWQMGAELKQLCALLGWEDLKDIASQLYAFGWSVISFEAGFINTIMTVTFFMTLFSFLVGFLRHLVIAGPIGLLLGTTASVLIWGPCTLLLWVLTPFSRLWILVNDDLIPAFSALSSGQEEAQPVSGQQIEEELLANPVVEQHTSDSEYTTHKHLLSNMWHNIKRRVSPAHPESFKNRPPAIQRLYCAIWSQMIRQNACNEAQFDFLFTLSKPVIPLLVLITTGQIFSSAMYHLVIGQGLRNAVPTLSVEFLHIITFMSGIFHSLLGASAADIEHQHELGRGIQLAWAGSYRDIFAVMNMAMLGAIITTHPGQGNQPLFSASLSAGVAARILMSEAVTGSLYQYSFRNFLQNQFNVVLANSEEVTARAISGVGDCSGGPIRMLFGSSHEWAASFSTIFLKSFLVVIPVVCTLQWLLQLKQVFDFGNLFSWKRVFYCSVLAIANAAQCALLGVYRLDASNGPLGNFWILVLLGCTLESLLSQYNIRGNARQAIFLMIYIGMP